MKLLDSLPPEKLTPAEEDDLAKKIQKSKNEDDINKLVLHNMREGFLYAKRVCRAKLPDDELFSVTYAALVLNAKRFRPGMIRFLAFSKMGIRGAISRYWKTFDVVKNASLHEVEDFPEEPADNLGRTKRRLFLAEEEVLRDYTPHVNPVVEDNSLVDPDFDSIETREQMKLVAEAMKDRLTDQERMVIDLVYRDGFSFQDIGNMLDITRAAVLSAHSKALKKIRIDLARQKRLLIRK